MPRKPIDYSNTHFYKIVCRDVNIQDCYVGHTTDFTKRKSQHKNHCNSDTTRVYNMPAYQFIRENGGWINWEMVLINTEKCENSLEAKKREREYIEERKATLNRVRPFVTTEEANEKKRETTNIYHKANMEREKEYRKNNKDRIRDYNKKYQSENKERIAQRRKQHYEEHRDEINKRRREKYHQTKKLQKQKEN